MKAAELIDVADSMLKNLTSSEVMRMISVSVQYSIMTDDFNALKLKLEHEGFMVGINNQFGKTVNFTLTYLRNWS